MSLELGNISLSQLPANRFRVLTGLPPVAGGPTDEALRADALATIAAHAAEIAREQAQDDFEDQPTTAEQRAFSASTEDWGEAYAVDTNLGYQMYWSHVHLANQIGFSGGDVSEYRRQAMGVGVEETDTGLIVKTERGMILRRADGGEWLLRGLDPELPVDGLTATVTGYRVGYDILEQPILRTT